ncbi:nuclear transport factor 2 family protein [Amycolatopsis cynarae]|uniref:Nuclear transport factor 2 family protein n=1 Tax=Amycolatopsis cynarae TaxID=2995223 RepID=A0ABY7B966_9PSEU|nr:nuclear transport factor 2 family protein [Amycolatopsis sp. HUAS 11-8]WAL68910.1 nuclear transport factor 2 family protein [Amycolatopsis sp. HUAS 11-8]
MPSNLDLVAGGYEAFAHGDPSAVFELFDEAMEWYTPDELPWGGAFHGREDVIRFFQELPRHYEELSVQPRRFLDAGDAVVVEGRYAGRVNGRDFKVAFAHVWTFREGRAVRGREYLDSGKLLRRMTEHGTATA